MDLSLEKSSSRLETPPSTKGAPYWLSLLADHGSFEPVGLPDTLGQEIIAGVARIHGRRVAVYAHNTEIDHGFISSTGARKIVRLMDLALAEQIPIVALLASPGISIHEGIKSGEEFTRLVMANTRCSGQILQIALVMGVVMGGSSYAALLMDFVIFNKRRSHLMISGPAVVKEAIGETSTLSQLGGAQQHATKTGVAHFLVDRIEDQFLCLKKLLDFLPSNGQSLPAQKPSLEPMADMPIIPFERGVSFDMESVIAAIVDASYHLCYSPEFGKSMITAFTRIGGHSVGIVANQSRYQSGAITADAAQKSARFIRLCDAYNIPIITLIDVPGYMVGSAEERKSILRHGATMIRSLNTRVPKLSVVVRRCYGAAAFVMMQTSSQNGDLVMALDQSRIAIMGFDAAKNIIYKDQYTPETEGILRRHYFEHYENPSIALRDGLIDTIVKPEEVRDSLVRTLNKITKDRTIKPFTQLIFP